MVEDILADEEPVEVQSEETVNQAIPDYYWEGPGWLTEIVPEVPLAPTDIPGPSVPPPAEEERFSPFFKELCEEVRASGRQLRAEEVQRAELFYELASMDIQPRAPITAMYSWEQLLNSHGASWLEGTGPRQRDVDTTQVAAGPGQHTVAKGKEPEVTEANRSPPPKVRIEEAGPSTIPPKVPRVFSSREQLREEIAMLGRHIRRDANQELGIYMDFFDQLRRLYSSSAQISPTLDECDWVQAITRVLPMTEAWIEYTGHLDICPPEGVMNWIQEFENAAINVTFGAGGLP